MSESRCSGFQRHLFGGAELVRRFADRDACPCEQGPQADGPAGGSQRRPAVPWRGFSGKTCHSAGLARLLSLPVLGGLSSRRKSLSSRCDLAGDHGSRSSSVLSSFLNIFFSRSSGRRDVTFSQRGGIRAGSHVVIKDLEASHRDALKISFSDHPPGVLTFRGLRQVCHGGSQEQTPRGRRIKGRVVPT